METPQLPAYLRTYVPIAWGWLLGLLVTQFPGIANILQTLNIDPQSPAVLTAISSALAIGWYALMRKIEPYIPDWLTTAFLGSPKVPEYMGATAGGPPIEATEVLFVNGDAETANQELHTGQSVDPNLPQNQPETRS